MAAGHVSENDLLVYLSFLLLGGSQTYRGTLQESGDISVVSKVAI